MPPETVHPLTEYPDITTEVKTSRVVSGGIVQATEENIRQPERDPPVSDQHGAKGEPTVFSHRTTKSRMLEMIAGGISLTDVLESFCRSIDDQAPNIRTAVLPIDPDGKRAGANSRASYSQRVDSGHRFVADRPMRRFVRHSATGRRAHGQLYA